MPPSSSDSPEKDREDLREEKSKERKGDSLEGDLSKGDGSWATKARDRKVLKKYDVEIQSKDGKNKVVIPDEILADSTPLWEEFVVYYIKVNKLHAQFQ